jgi:hypothetical protein
MSLLAVSQIAELAALVYELVPAGEVMVDNLEELLRVRVEDKLRAKFAPSEFAGTFVMPTSDQLPKVALPFMPECVRYIGCKAIKLAGGLFVPCGGKTKTEFCAACSKKAAEKGKHEYGVLAERQAAFDKGELYTVGDKTEITFGDFMASKKLDQPTVKASLREAGLSLNIPVRCLAVTEGAKKKRSGRPAKKAEAAPEVGSDEEVEAAAPQPKAPRVKLSLEEKLAKVKADLEEKAAKAAEREAKIAENKAKKEAEKAAKEAEKAAKEAEKAAKKAAEPEKKEKKAKKTAEVQEQMAALDESNAAAAEEFKLIKQKGVTMKYDAAFKVYAESDNNNTMQLGNWTNDERKTVDFLPNMAACIVISDQIEHVMGEGSKSEMKFLMSGAIFTANFEKKTITCKKPPAGFTLALDEDMKVELTRDESESEEDGGSESEGDLSEGEN